MTKLYHGTIQSYLPKIKRFGGLFATEGVSGYIGIHMTTNYRRAEEWAERGVFSPKDKVAVLEVTIPQEYEKYLHPDFNSLSHDGWNIKELNDMKWQWEEDVVYNPCVDPSKFVNLNEQWGEESKKCMIPSKWVKVCKSDGCEQKSNL